MESIKNLKVLAAPVFTIILLGLPLQAYAAWPDAGMVSPNIGPSQQPVHQIHINAAPPARVEPQHQNRPEPQRTVVHNTAPVSNNTQPAKQEITADHRQDNRRHDSTPVYFRHDTHYYRYDQGNVVYTDINDINPPLAVPDGFETIVVDGQTFYYSGGVFYQQIDGQLTAIPPVLGAVVDSIPADYQIVMADGDHYLYTGGVYYQRVDDGFEVVQPPVEEDS